MWCNEKHEFVRIMWEIIERKRENIDEGSEKNKLWNYCEILKKERKRIIAKKKKEIHCESSRGRKRNKCTERKGRAVLWWRLVTKKLVKIKKGLVIRLKEEINVVLTVVLRPVSELFLLSHTFLFGSIEWVTLLALFRTDW